MKIVIRTVLFHFLHLCTCKTPILSYYISIINNFSGRGLPIANILILYLTVIKPCSSCSFSSYINIL